MLAQNDSFSLIVPHSTSIHKKDDALAGTRLSPHTKIRDIVSHLPDLKRPSLVRRRRYRRRKLFISSWSAQEQVPAVASSSGADLTWSLEETYLGDTCFDWDSFTTLTTPNFDFDILDTDNRLLDTSTTTTDGVTTMPLTATSANVIQPAALQSMMDGTGDFYDPSPSWNTTSTDPTNTYSSSDHSIPSSTQQSPDFVLFPSPNISNSKSTKSSSSKSTTARHSPSSEGESKVCKRQRNTEAARRYRQRKVDRVTELEEALTAMQKERDELKLKLARSEAEADVLRRLHAK